MRAIELFAGAGGAALGLEAAGIEHAALCEWDPHACATLRAAGLGPVVEGDVRDLDAIAAAAGESCDLLWSSFPCQAWSTAGKRKGARDQRNGWPWTVDAIDRFRPRWFVGENVRGLLNHRGGCVYGGGTLDLFGADPSLDCPRCYFDRVILRQLRQRFDHVGFWLLDAADYGVPQHRRRVILWAGPVPLEKPTATHGPGRALDWNTLQSASDPPVGRGGYWDRPAPCVRCGDSTDFQFQAELLQVRGVRRLTLNECARLQDFPDAHPWQGSRAARYRQIGNAVPPTLARVAGQRVVEAEARRGPDSH